MNRRQRRVNLRHLRQRRVNPLLRQPRRRRLLKVGHLLKRAPVAVHPEGFVEAVVVVEAVDSAVAVMRRNARAVQRARRRRWSQRPEIG